MGLFTRVPGTAREDASSVQTNIVGVGFLLRLAIGALEACEANHNGDREALFMSPFEIAIERHVDPTLTAPVFGGKLVTANADDRNTILLCWPFGTLAEGMDVRRLRDETAN